MDAPATSWLVKDLRKYLADHGGKITGTKTELLERYVQNFCIFHQMIYFLLSEGFLAFRCFPCRAIFYHTNPGAAQTKASVRRKTKAKTAASSADDRGEEPVFPVDGWSSDRRTFPYVDAATVLGHLLGTGKLVPSKDGEVVVVQKPLRRGNEFFFGGYVHDLQVACGDDGHVFVRAKCWASQSKKKKYSMRLVLAQMDDEAIGAAVSFAKCDGCPAGQCGGLCQHVFALLMVLEYYGPRPDLQEVPHDQPVTSLPQSWGPRQRNVRPQPSMQTVIERPKFDAERKRKAVTCSLYEARAANVQVTSKKEIMSMRAMLHPCRMRDLLPDDEKDIAYGRTSFGNAPLGSVISYQLLEDPITVAPAAPPSAPGRTAVTSAVAFPAVPFCYVPCPEALVASGKSVSLEHAQQVGRDTVGQSGNELWTRYHRTVLTSSNFHKVLRNRNASVAFLSSLFSPRDLGNVSSIKHGRQHEAVAVEQYCLSKRRAGTPVQVQECGLLLHTSLPFLGASPDRIVYDASVSPAFGLLEVKCPYTVFRDGLSMEEAAREPGFCLASVDGGLKLRSNHAYYTQVQGQLGISGAEWCDFHVWAGQHWHTERIKADTTLWNGTILPKLVDFYNDHAVPYLTLRDQPDDLSTSVSECIFPSDICQSRIAGRDGSNACTVIASLFCLSFLQGQLPSAPVDALDMVKSVLLAGNTWYDETGQTGLLAVDEVLSAQPSIGADNAGELFVDISQLDAVLVLLAETAGEARSAGVLVANPYSFALLYDGASRTLVLFDSHAHAADGALLASIPHASALQFIKQFFTRFYGHLLLGVAQFTLLSMKV